MAGTGTASERQNRLAPYLLVAPGILWLIIFFVIPIATLAKTSVTVPNGPWWDAYGHALGDYHVHFLRSFRYAITATLMALALGYPLAYVIAFRGGRLKNLLLGLVILPFFTTFLVRTFAWKTILNDNGPAVWLLRQVHLISADGRLLDTTLAVLGGLTYNFVPFMILPIYVSLEKIDRRLVEAAEDLYCSPMQAFFKVVLPLSLPGVFAGSLLTFIPATGDFINAQLLGSPNQQMIGTVIQNQFLEVRDYPLAASLSFVLMIVITLGVLAYTRVLGTEDLA
ncbi:MAG: ABC transporter permease [Gemmatimonadales bacterium]